MLWKFLDFIQMDFKRHSLSDGVPFCILLYILGLVSRELEQPFASQSELFNAWIDCYIFCNMHFLCTADGAVEFVLWIAFNICLTQEYCYSNAAMITPFKNIPMNYNDGKTSILLISHSSIYFLCCPLVLLLCKQIQSQK